MKQPLLENHKDGVQLRVRLMPKASRNSIGQVETDASGQCYLKVFVTAVPEKGKANKALIKLLSKEWNLPRSSIFIASGKTDRNKILVIREDIDQLAARIRPE